MQKNLEQLHDELADLQEKKEEFTKSGDEKETDKDYLLIRDQLAVFRENFISLERDLHLEEQYESQKQILEAAAFLDILSNGE